MVGVGRSGTTLIQSMLNAHPEICFPPETHFVKRYIVPFLNRTKLSKSELIEKLAKDVDMKKLGLDWSKFIDDSNFENLADFYKSVLVHFSEKADKSHCGDKDPMNVRFIPHIKKCFPGAYIVHIYRDPRDVILSRLKSGWGDKTPFYRHVGEYHHGIEKVLNDGPDLFGEKFINLKYEDLLQNPEKELKRISNAIEIDYSEEMLAYQDKAKDLVQGKEVAWKGNVFKPVMKDNSEKWRKELNPEKIDLIESGLEPIMEELGYELSGFVTRKQAWKKLKIKMVKHMFLLSDKKNSVKIG